MEISRLPIDGYEEVYRATDDRAGLLAFIAVHDTTLGPSLGGCRMWHYSREEDAITDALRLSEGMTFKSAVAATGLGGGKAVIVGDPKTNKTPELFKAMGRFVNTLSGRYITAEDVGTNEGDMLNVRAETKHVSGLPREEGGSGDPSPYTARGVFLGLKAAVEMRLEQESLDGLTVALQGVGNVGFHLGHMLREAGCKLVVTDVNEERLQAAAKELDAEIVDSRAIYGVECDVFSPNALGAVINDRTLPQLKCKVVAGGANNQLAEPRHGEALLKRDILYAPDFVLNAGGIINVSVEFAEGGYDEKKSLEKVDRIHTAMKDIIRTSREQEIPTSQAAVVLAKQILDEARMQSGGAGGAKML